MPAQVRGPVAQERSRRMHALGAELRNAIQLETRRPNRMDVLWETAEDLGDTLRWSGLTPNYVRVAALTRPDEDLSNRVTPTEIVEAVPGGLVGRVLNS